MKALLVEDNPADVRLIREIVKESPGERLCLEHVARLDAAVEQLGRESFDVVLLDLGLPDSQGVETLELMQKGSSGVPIVVLTGLDDERFALEAMRSGAQDYLVKGRFDRDLLLRTVRYAVERKRAEEALRRLNRELRAISDCNQVLLRATDEPTLLKEVCRIVCEEAGYRPVWVSYVEHDEAKSMRPVAWAGTDETYLKNAGIRWSEDTERGRGPTGTAIRSGKVCCIQDFATDPRVAPWREILLQGGFRSAIALPLKDEHAKVFGSLTMHSGQPNAFTPEEIHLLEELAADLAFGIVALRSQAERKQAEQEVALLTFAVDNVQEAALLIDETGHFHYVNAEACRVLGYTRAELLGMGVPDIDVEFPAGRWADHWRDLKAQRLLSFESRHRTRGGRIFPVEVSANYFEYEGRAYDLALLRDITERKQAQEALEQERRLFISGPNVAYRVCAAAGWPLEYVSPNMKDQFGYEPEALVREKVPAARLIHPDDLPRVAKEIEAHSNAGELYFSVEYRIVHANGECRWVYDFVVVRRDVNGLITHYYGYLTDITERKRAEEALRQSETTLNRAQEIAQIGSWHLDVARNRLTWSDEVFRIFGVPLGTALTYEAFLDRVHPADRESVDNAWSAALHGAPYDIEHRIIVGGDVKWVREQAELEFSKEGNTTSGIGTVQDITERKRAEEERRESAERFRAIADYTYDWENWIGVDGKLLWVNPAVERITGYSVSECMVMPDFPLPMVAEADREAVAGQMREAVQGSSRNDFEFRVRHKDGRLEWVAASWQPIYDSRGARLGYRSSIRNIGERKQAEEAVRRGETYLAESQRLSHTGSWGFDVASNKYVYASEECLRIFELDAQRDWPAREAVSRLIHPEDWDRTDADFEKCLREKVDTPSEFRIVLPSGAVKDVHVIRHPVLNDTGEVVALGGTAIDITDRKRAEKALRRSEAYLSESQRLTRTGSWALDVVNNKLAGWSYWSDEMFRIFGFDPKEGLPPREAVFGRILPQYLNETEGSLQKALRDKIDTSVDYRLMLPDGTIKHIHIIRHPVLNEAGEVVQLVGTAIDVTERKRAEEALRESETRFRTFVDHAAEAFFMLDLDQGTILDMNQSACDSLGYSRPELIGKTPMAFDVDLDRATFESIARRAAEGETVSFDRHWHRRKDGSLLPVEVHTSLFQHGGRRFLLKVARDITDRLRVEEEREKLRQLETDLAHMGRVSLLGELVASLAHELKQPITGAMTSANACLRWLARDPPELERARAAAMRIEKDGSRAAEIIDRLRAFYKKGGPPRRESVDVGKVINDIRILLRNQAERHSITIRTDLTAEFPNVFADRVQLQQVFMNLMLNAIDAMKDAGGELTVRSQPIEHDGMLLSVSDTGVGLPTENTDQIFKAFFTTKAQGTGMGLAITRSIIEAHGGRVWASNNAERGATFYFTLPMEAGALNEESAVADGLHH